MDSVFKTTLRAELDFQDITTKELSVRTGISARTLESYLNARASIPPADVAFRIAQALNVSVEYLVTGNPKYNGKSSYKNSTIEDKINTSSVEKKTLIRDFISLLDNFEISKKSV